MQKVILAILDGVGYSESVRGNAFKQAKMPFYKSLLNEYPNALIAASETAIGLPSGQMGNSEVGHLTMGAGRVIVQPLERVNKAIATKEIYEKEELLQVINHVKENKSSLHICGLLSDGGVHSHINHILTLIDVAKQNNIETLYLHVFLDGRDTLPQSALKYLDQLNKYIRDNNFGIIATISGRYYAMDREKAWDRTKTAYDAIVNGIGKYNDNYTDAIEEAYRNGETDEFVTPIVINKISSINDNDGIILANFRPDRTTQLFSAITNPEFFEFKRKQLKNIKLTTMMPVDNSIICTNIFKHETCDNTLLEVLNDNKYKILQIAEVSKFPHVTHFFQGDKDIELDNATKVQIPNKDVKTYDLAPEMSAMEITNEIIKQGNNYDFILVNYANGDMVGHTGNLKACIEALETLDKCIENLYNFAQENKYLLIITADHGNCEQMVSENNEILTAHTTNPVYLLACDNNYLVETGNLSNIAPSILNICDIKVPEEMVKEIIIEKKIEII